MPKEPPVCRKCGKSHWHFVRCDNLPEYREAQRKVRELKAPPLLRSRKTPWKDDALLQPLPKLVRPSLVVYPKDS